MLLCALHSSKVVTHTQWFSKGCACAQSEHNYIPHHVSFPYNCPLLEKECTIGPMLLLLLTTTLAFIIDILKMLKATINGNYKPFKNKMMIELPLLLLLVLLHEMTNKKVTFLMT